MQRIAKLIAASGLCSRREAEQWIRAGRVKVDGTVIDSPALNVSPQQNILVDGKKLPRNETVRLWKFHKPKGCITTRRDEKGRKTVYDFLPPEMHKLHTIGRLDYNSEGLLLLTNSPELKRRFELPATALERTYRVRVFGMPTDKTLHALAKGVTVEGVRYKAITTSFEETPTRASARREAAGGAKRGGQAPPSNNKNHWLTVTLTEGKNREIRKLFEHFGHPVSRLIRTAYGPFALDDLKPAEVKECADAVRKLAQSALKNQFGKLPWEGDLNAMRANRHSPD